MQLYSSYLPLIRYRKVPKNKPGGLYFSKALFEGLIFGGAYIRRGLPMEGNLRFKIDWASLTVAYSWKEIDRFCFILICI